MAIPIKFGTDGWRAIIADDYTVDNVKRVSEATALYMKARKMKKVVIGHDCRFAGELFAETAASVMCAHGIQVVIAKGFVSTPMVSLGVVKTKSDLGIVITASHNPPSYNGFKLKSMYGGPLIPSEVNEVEVLIPEVCSLPTLKAVKELESKGKLKYVDLEKMYLQHCRKHFDIKLIKDSGLKIAYDAMYGAGQNVIKKLLPRSVFIHCDDNPSFRGQAPEPILRNLTELCEVVRKNPKITAGLANDGDADRIGMVDEDGNFVDSHHLLLILLLYLYKYKKQTGKVVYTFSVTDKMKKMSDLFGLKSECTKIGFKYIAEIMMHEDVLVGGEESGGLAVKGHIPERDGIWVGLMVFEFMAVTGKTMKGLVKEVYDTVGSFASDRDDLRVSEEVKSKVISGCKSKAYTSFGKYKVQSMEDIDGWKFNLGNESWTMIRASGTEPVLRAYAQAPTFAEARAILDAVQATIL